MADLNREKKERKESPVYTGPQTESPISANRIIVGVLVSAFFVIACVLLIVAIAVTR